MRQKREYRIFTFHTTAAAMEMEAFAGNRESEGAWCLSHANSQQAVELPGGWNRRNMNGFRE